MNKQSIIAICGIDGSGKTTQIKLLEKYLKERGFKVKYVWFRWTAFFSYPILALCRLLGYTKWRTIGGSGVRYAEREFYMNKTLAKIWPWFFTLDTFIHLIFRIKIRNILGYIILCDRFILDIFVDLMYETKDYRLPKSLIGRILFSLMPKNSKLVIIDVDESIAYLRKRDIPSIDYLKKRRELYIMLAKILRIPIVNGGREIWKIHEDILNIIKE